LVQQIHPSLADDSNKHVGLSKGPIQLLIKASTGEQVVDTHENVRFTEFAGERVPNTCGARWIIIAPIIYKYLSHRVRLDINLLQSGYNTSV
jgi:hypothetical protein